MQTLFTKATNIRLKILAWYQIIGGISGIGFSIWLLAQVTKLNGLMAILYLVAFTLYAFSTYCGYLLFGDKYRLGLKLSVVNQLLQVFSFLYAGYGFMYISGLMLLVSLKYGTGSAGNGLVLGFNFGLISSWRFYFHSVIQSFDFSINFVAVYLTCFIYLLRRRIVVEKAKAQ